MKGYSSFMSEHTTEYVLVPRLINVLSKNFSEIIPIFPWITREGNNLSRLIHQSDEFYVVGLFCKRPKISNESESTIIKINEQFLISASISSELNIPIIAGCPLVRSLWELNSAAKCIWIKLCSETKSFYEIPFKEKAITGYTFSISTLFNNEEDLLNYLLGSCIEMDFKSFGEKIRLIKQSNPSNSFFGFGYYKPIYFLLKK